MTVKFYQVVDIHPSDFFYSDKETIIGLVFEKCESFDLQMGEGFIAADCGRPIVENAHPCRFADFFFLGAKFKILRI